MLNVRIHCPPRLTQPVTSALTASGGAVHLTVSLGAGIDPVGDVVTCDLPRQAADEVFDALRGLGLGEAGAVVVAPVEAVLFDLAEDQAEPRTRTAGAGAGAATGAAPADALVWDDLLAAAAENAQLSRTFLAFMAIAMMIAACGIELDNPILIVGSMVVGPDYAPLGALSVSLAMRRWPLAGRALRTVLEGFVFGILVTALFGVIMRALDLFSVAALSLPHPNTGFIWHPDAFSFVVSWLGGVAGMLAITSAESSLLVGVVISVTTIPAAAASALNLADLRYIDGRGAAVQLLINLAGIVAAGSLTLVVRRSRRGIVVRWLSKKSYRASP